MMIIQIDETIRIRGTKTCYQLERKRNRRSGYQWEPYKYFMRFGDALGAACEQDLRTHPAQGIAEALEAATRLSQKYGELLDYGLAEISKRTDTKLQDVA